MTHQSVPYFRVVMQASLLCLLGLIARAAAADPAPLDQAAADRDAGYYQIGPQRAVHFWREGDHFYFGAVGSPQRAEATPDASGKFSFGNGAVTFTFNTGADGKTNGVTVNQAGRDILAPRIDEAVAKASQSRAVPAPKRRCLAPGP